jgi:thiol-disulfide isomerase/thioredoxin
MTAKSLALQRIRHPCRLTRMQSRPLPDLAQTPQAEPRWLVTCLCAAWCRTCDGYRASFDAVARDFPGWRFVWIDIEDESALVDDYDVNTFPSLLVGHGLTLCFAGPVTPQPQTLARLLASLRERTGASTAHDAAARALWQRLQAAPAGS